MSQLKLSHALCLIGFFFLALMLRLDSLDSKYFHIDEAHHLYIASQPHLKDVFHALRNSGPYQHPLGYVVDHAAQKIAPGYLTSRLLSVLWGCCAVLVLYGLGNIVYGRKLALILACLLTISIIHIEYSQTLRYYALIVFLFSLAHLSFLKIGSARHWTWVYSLSMLASQWIYPYTIVMGLVHLGMSFYFKRLYLRSIITALSLSWAGLVVWFFLFGKGFVETANFSFPREATLSMALLFDVFVRFGQNNTAVAVIYGVLFLIGVVSASNIPERRFETITSLVLLLAIPLVVIGSLLLIKQAFYPRYILAIFPIYLGFVGAGFLWLAQRPRVGRAGILVVMSVVLFFSFRSLTRMKSGEAVINGWYQNAAQTLRAQIKNGDVVVLSNPNMGAVFLHYLDPKAFLHLLPPQLDQGFALFQFPNPFVWELDGKQVQFFSLCLKNQNFATLNEVGFQQLQKDVVAAGQSIWLVDLRGNYFAEDQSFEQGLHLQSEERVMILPGLSKLATPTP